MMKKDTKKTKFDLIVCAIDACDFKPLSRRMFNKLTDEELDRAVDDAVGYIPTIRTSKSSTVDDQTRSDAIHDTVMTYARLTDVANLSRVLNTFKSFIELDGKLDRELSDVFIDRAQNVFEVLHTDFLLNVKWLSQYARAVQEVRTYVTLFVNEIENHNVRQVATPDEIAAVKEACDALGVAYDDEKGKTPNP